MTEPSNDVTPGTPRGPVLHNLIDLVCDKFEAALRADQKPRIEDFLAAYPHLDRWALLRELIALEMDYYNSIGDTVRFADYYTRFPKETPVIDAIQAEHESDLSSEFHETAVYPEETSKVRINQFELLSILGQGGFGIVWRARDHRLERDVAIKVPRADWISPAEQALFLREARAVAKLRHPGIVPVYEVGEESTASYIVSELIEGGSLKDQLKKHPFSARDAAVLVSKLAMALHHAHELGVVHRDMKPANVLIDSAGEPHVTDFGLAKRESAEDSLSIDGKIMGTPAYMSPEQANGEHHLIDRRTDIYSLGCILYEQLTGRVPFRGEVAMILQQIRDALPEPPRSIKPEIPRDLDAICLKCLQKDRDKRYSTAQELAEDLNLFLAGETLRGIRPALPDRVQKWVAKHRRWLLSVSVSFVFAATLAGTFAWFIRPVVEPVPENLRAVEFTTQPEGCEITVVAIDPDTGEPDPSKIQSAQKRSPVIMNLSPGDYLVVAVLNELQFHEVYRRVPAAAENVPMKSRSTWWTLGPSGIVCVNSISIPRPDVTLPMGFVPGTNRLVRPLGREVAESDNWSLPPFYVDLSEISIDDLRDGTYEHFVRDAGPGPSVLLNYFACLTILEDQGKRFPSAAELYYLSHVICPSPPEGQDDLGGELQDKKRIVGLHSSALEWTSTQPGGPFSGMKGKAKPYGLAALPRMIGGGKIANAETIAPNGLGASVEHLNSAGARGVRSARPRLKPTDFQRPNH